MCRVPCLCFSKSHCQGCVQWWHSTLRNPHSALYTLHSTLYTLNSTLYTLHFTLHTSHFKLHTLHFTLYTPHFTLYISHSALYTPHSTLYTLHPTLDTPHFTLYTPQFTLLYSTRYTLPSTLYTPVLFSHNYDFGVCYHTCGHSGSWVSSCFLRRTSEIGKNHDSSSVFDQRKGWICRDYSLSLVRVEPCCCCCCCCWVFHQLRWNVPCNVANQNLFNGMLSVIEVVVNLFPPILRLS